ncbi:MAG: hypothetical protein PHI83_08825 [Sphaerochaetaceae bacterium]|nr:hypothetical protein [Sphaerochaetaceae bacterium]
MKGSFSEAKVFQVKPEKIEEFKSLASQMAESQEKREGCLGIRYMKRFYVFDDINEKPRKLTRIVKCIKYYSYWEFDSIESYAKATSWFFETYNQVFRLLIMPFDINCGESLF